MRSFQLPGSDAIPSFQANMGGKCLAIITMMSDVLVRLPLWFFRRSWPMLLLMGSGILAGITLACSVPILTFASVTLSLQHTLKQPYRNTIVVADSQLSSTSVTAITAQFASFTQTALDPYVLPQSELSLRTQDYALASRSGQIHFKGFPGDYLASQFTLVQGRQPQENSSAFEVLLSQQAADMLSVQVGSVLAVVPDLSSLRRLPGLVQVVGIVTPVASDIHDPFDYEPIDPIASSGQLSYAALMLDAPLLSLNDALQAPGEQSIQGLWVARLDPARVTADNLTIVQDRLLSFNQLERQQLSPYRGNSSMYGDAYPTIQQYNDTVKNTQVPLVALFLQMLILAFWFCTTIAYQVIEHHAGMLANIRSRGASAWQIVLAFMMPALGISLACILTGPFLAVVAVRIVIDRFIPGSGTSSEVLLQIGRSSPVLAQMQWYSLGITGALLIALLFTFYRKLALNLRTVRQEAARATQQAFWQRYHLDSAGMLMLLGFYGLYVFYLSAFTNPDTYAALSVFSVYVPVVLMTTGAMFVARMFTWLLRHMKPIAASRRGVVWLLTQVRLAEAQKKIAQVTIFLALAITLGAFVLVYQASEEQHTRDYVAFQVGADFGGALPINADQSRAPEQQASFLRIPGVQAASLGAIINIFGSSGSPQTPSLRLLAVDARTYGQVGIWPNKPGYQLPQLMHLLVDQRGASQASGSIPAIIDDAMAQTLDLAPGRPFTLDVSSGKGTLRLHFIALQQVMQIPMIVDKPGYSTGTFAGGLLVDFPTLVTAIQQRYPNQQAVPGHVWLKTSGDPATIQAIRERLRQAPYGIAGIVDRFQLLEDMRFAPLGLALEGMILIGATMAIILAVIALLAVFWSTFHKRLLNLTILYAMGARRRHILSTLLLEDGILLLLAMGIGIMLCLPLAGMTIPLMTYAQISDTQQPVINLLAPPPQIVVLWPAIGIFLGSMLCFCLLAMLGLTRARIRSQAGATLRLNED